MADSDNDSGGGGGGNAESSAGSLAAREQDRFLPIANVSRIMKKALPANAKISKEAKETVQECVSEFISFITGEASDKCQKEKRKTINGDDLLWAMTTLGFEEYIEPLKVYLQKFRELEGEKTATALGGKPQGDREADGSIVNSVSSGVSFGNPGMYGVMPQGGMMMMGSGGHPHHHSHHQHHHMYGSGGGGGGSPSSRPSSSSSNGADESFSDIREPENRKRKRRTERKLQLALMENMAMKLMERQEQMHKQLIDMIENRERERISQEEAWQHQQMERMKRNEELRAQEASRSLALISFIQKMLAQDFPETQPVKFCPEERQLETHPDDDVSSDSINKRWSDDEVQALISLRSALDRRFHATVSGGLVWEEMSTGMSNLGYRRSAKKCKEKWENINKYFKKSTGEGKRQLENSKTCPYFRDLDILYKNGLVNSGNAPEVTKSVGG